MSDELTYNVVYAGAILANFNVSDVQSSFVSQLNKPENKFAQLFNGKRITLKKALSKQKAEMWQNKLLTIGAETVIVPNVTVDKKLSTEMTNNKNTSPGNSSTSKK